MERKEWEEKFIEKLRYEEEKIDKKGIKVMVEKINKRNMKGYLIVNKMEEVGIVKRVKRKNVEVKIDIYNEKIMDGEMKRMIEKMKGELRNVKIE